MKTLKNTLVLFVLNLFVLHAFSQAPVISDFAPYSGNAGTTITITGTNFDLTPANNLVKFGVIKAVVTSASSTQLTVTVPLSADYQPISVLNLTSGLSAVSNKRFMPGFSSCGTLNSTNLAPKNEFFTDAVSFYNVYTDVDGDGRGDIIYFNSNILMMLLNIGSPGAPMFNGRAVFNQGSGNSNRISAGDLTGDGKPEIVTSNSTTHQFSVRINTSVPGTTSFNTPLDFNASVSYPDNSTIGDIDGDGKNDIIIVGRGPSPRISISRNTSSGGSISFATPVTFPLGSITNSSVATLSDIDGDGKPDIVLDGNSIYVFRNTSTSGSISLSAMQSFPAAALCSGISIADLDGDGKPDVSVVNRSINSISIFRNTSASGSVSFATRVDHATTPYPRRSFYLRHGWRQ